MSPDKVTGKLIVKKYLKKTVKNKNKKKVEILEVSDRAITNIYSYLCELSIQYP